MGPNISVLLVDDEPRILRSLAVSLEARGFAVSTATTAEHAIDALARERPDVMIVDVMLPGIDGVALVKHVRERWTLPIIMLSAIGEQERKVEALEVGADDYVTKPFGVEELIARTKSVLRRAVGGRDTRTVLTYRELTVRVDRREVRLGARKLKLTPTEFELLLVLMQQPGRVLTHGMLLQEVWGPAAADQVQYLRVFIGQLRKKVEADPTRPVYLITEPGVGYRFAGDQD